MSQIPKKGFTLVELLVVIAIIGVLIALLLPAVQAAREAARRSSCTNKLKQLGLATHNYHDVNKKFPYGFASGATDDLSHPDRTCWMQLILPFMEQENMYTQFKKFQSTTPAIGGRYYIMDTPVAIKDAVLDGFVCPSEANAPNFGGGGGLRSGGYGFQGSYVGLSGNGIMLYSGDTNGIYYRMSPTKFASVTDGTSNTFLYSEVITRVAPSHGGWGGGGGYWGGAPHGSYGFSTLETPNTTIADRVYSCKTSMPIAPCTGTTTSNNHANFARSYHPTGVQACLADASVRFVTETINPATYNALGTRAGGEVTSEY